LGDLVGAVAPVAGELVDLNGLEQPDAVVVAKGLDREVVAFAKSPMPIVAGAITTGINSPLSGESTAHAGLDSPPGEDAFWRRAP
jgi:hypothetical protein